MRNLLLGSALALSVIACQSDKIIFEEVDELQESLWAYDDPYEYSFEVTDTSAVYRLLFYIDFSTGYDWQNLYTSITTTFPNDSSRTDVVSFELADKTGAWYGTCNSDRCKLNIPLQEKVRFPMPGTYVITFEQYMREESITGINAIGLKLVEPAPE